MAEFFDSLIHHRFAPARDRFTSAPFREASHPWRGFFVDPTAPRGGGGGGGGGGAPPPPRGPPPEDCPLTVGGCPQIRLTTPLRRARPVPAHGTATPRPTPAPVTIATRTSKKRMASCGVLSKIAPPQPFCGPRLGYVPALHLDP